MASPLVVDVAAGFIAPDRFVVAGEALRPVIVTESFDLAVSLQLSLALGPPRPLNETLSAAVGLLGGLHATGWLHRHFGLAGALRVGGFFGHGLVGPPWFPPSVLMSVAVQATGSLRVRFGARGQFTAGVEGGLSFTTGSALTDTGPLATAHFSYAF